ncbi:hypothetical protein AB0H83_29915 [Dactylosporangium sp. NPDC050688]|uniref:hypothetical protein n=1 Tax=Dactylosporangium sp. NPDC050688 TaxID=3157217 RepID=UPI0033E98720
MSLKVISTGGRPVSDATTVRAQLSWSRVPSFAPTAPVVIVVTHAASAMPATNCTTAST